MKMTPPSEPMGRRLISSDEGVIAEKQHHRPCSDCPFARTALPGWTGSDTPEEYVQAAHSESRMECHTLLGAQCAGAAIYRANVYKLPSDPDHLKLPSDRERVFASRNEFLDHHEGADDGI
ncbi:MAG: hypothetical protein PHS14_18055 [Elusimicrobia bacterium]|nr:hypothetical protein [Elusimicrobiota bacterium]